MNTSRAGPALVLPGLLIILLGGLAVRLLYLLQASPFVDEYSTLMAVQGILAHGIPFLPSGFFYGHDLLYSYAATAAAVLLPGDLLAVRLLSLAASVVAIVLIFVIGRQLFSARAGLMSAALLAWLPAFVLWGARARAYALESSLSLAAFWFFYRGVTDGNRTLRRAGYVAIVAAVWCHPEAALLLPALALATLILRGFRWWLRPDRLIEFVLAGAAIMGRYLVQKMVAGGSVGGFSTVANARPTFSLLSGWQTGWATVAAFLGDGPLIPTTMLALVAVLALALRRSRDPASANRINAARFLTSILTVILLQMALLIGSTWQSVRYLLFAYPFLFLLAGAGLEVVITWLAAHMRRLAAQIASAILVIATLAPLVPAAIRAARTTEIAYDRAFEYVAAHRQPGDRLATLAPAAAWLTLGQVDYFALGRTYEEFVWQQNGRWYDKWVGAELIHDATGLSKVLDQVEAQNRTLWLVTDETRLLQRYDPDFVQTIWDRMELVYSSDRAQVFRSTPGRQYALVVDTPRPETFADRIALAGYAIGSLDQVGSPPQGALSVRPGQSVPIRLDWQALTPLTTTYTFFLHMTAADGSGYAQDDGPPLNGLYPMHLWQPEIRYPDHRSLELPSELPAGRYRLEIGFYRLDTGDRLPVTAGPGRLPDEALILDYVNVGGAEPAPPPARPLDAELGGAIRLYGLSPAVDDITAQPGEQLSLELHWLALAPAAENYTLFVHMLGPDGAIQAQYDGPPQGGFYPTAFWDPGERLVDRVWLSIPADTAPGRYPIIAGLYLLATGERLPVTGADAGPARTVKLGTLVVEP